MKIRNTPSLTIERLKAILDYDPTTGVFRWRINRPKARPQQWKGDFAGTVNTNGYIWMYIDGARYFAHHLAWFYVHTEWPKSWLDHRNGVRTDNTIDNLRPATPAENAANSRGWTKRKSPFKGVYPQLKSSRNPWYAAIRRDNKLIYLGSFPTAKMAHRVYMAAAIRSSGEFARGS